MKVKLDELYNLWIGDMCITIPHCELITKTTYSNVWNWSLYEFDLLGNLLKYRNSTGTWYEYTRDSDGNVMTYEDCNGNMFNKQIQCSG